MLTIADIEAARTRIAGGIYESPCVESVPLSQLTGAHISCKLDYLQRTGSFKERGARNALLRLPEEARQRGVIAASAGNHAQGIAYHAGLLGIPATVVMPKFAALIKVSNCRHLGATVILHGADIGEARTLAEEIAQRDLLTFIHPFDNFDVMAGQGTMALEILEQTPDLDAVVVPVGGGGLIAGIGTVMRARKPAVRVIGCMWCTRRVYRRSPRDVVAASCCLAEPCWASPSPCISTISAFNRLTIGESRNAPSRVRYFSAK